MKPPSPSAARTLVIIGAASGAGAPDPATAEGPDALRHYRVFHDTPLQHVEWDAILRVPRAQQDTPLHAVAALGAQLAAEVAAVLQAGNFPLVVGGDHSCAIGTWSGVHRVLAVTKLQLGCAERAPLHLRQERVKRGGRFVGVVDQARVKRAGHAVHGLVSRSVG